MPSKSAGATHSITSRTRSGAIKSQSSIFTKYIGNLRVSPAEQLQLSLGVFGIDRPEKGFSISLSPDPNPSESVVTEILSVGSATRHELFLCLANFSDKLVTAEVWAM